MKRSLSVLLMAACPILVHAAIYKSVDENGHVTYSNAPIKGNASKVIVLEPLPTMPPPRRSSGGGGGESTTPADFPRVDGETQQRRDDKRRDILEEEMAAEERLLTEAKQKLRAEEQNPRVFTTQNGEKRRNVALQEESIKNAQEQVNLHQGNINALKIELSKIK